MSVTISQIVASVSAALTAAGLPIGGVSPSNSGGDANSTFTLLFDGVTTVRLDWSVSPSGPQVTQADAIVVSSSNPLLIAQQLQTAALYAQTVSMRQQAFPPQDYVDLLSIIVFNGSTGIQPLTNRFNYALQAFQYTGVVTGALEAAAAAINAAPDQNTVFAVQLPTQQTPITQTGSLSGSTLSGLTSTAQIVQGMAVTGPGITPNSHSFTGTTVAGSATVTSVSSISGLAVGQSITGTGIPANTFIVSVVSGTIMLSQAATASASGVSLTSQNANVTVATVPSSTSVTLTGGTFTTQTNQPYVFAIPVAPIVTLLVARGINN